MASCSMSGCNLACHAKYGPIYPDAGRDAVCQTVLKGLGKIARIDQADFAATHASKEDM